MKEGKRRGRRRTWKKEKGTEEGRELWKGRRKGEGMERGKRIVFMDFEDVSSL